jgi:thioredoxin 1
MEITLTDDNFEQEVLKSDKPFLVDFWAPWCGPCKMVSPVVSEIAEEMKDKLRVGKMNVDEHSQTPQQYQISSIPSLKIFKDGKIVNEIIGAAPKATIEAKIKEILEISN